MIELLDPRKIVPVHSDLWMHAGWSYILDYSWIIEKSDKCNHGLILDVGCGVSPYSSLGDVLSSIHGSPCIGIDRNMGIEFMDYDPPSAPSLIFWASSLEHNIAASMRSLYLRSMEMLAPGGIFLATITISRFTHWFDPSVNQCLSPQEAAVLFDEPEMLGEFEDVWQAYRDHEFMMEKYLSRYGHFSPLDPEFIIAGVSKVKP